MVSWNRISVGTGSRFPPLVVGKAGPPSVTEAGMGKRGECTFVLLLEVFDLGVLLGQEDVWLVLTQLL